MNDEYGKLDAAALVHVFPSFQLESKRVLRDVPVAYHTYGTLNAHRSNTVVVCHALTGNSDAGTWWSNVVGPGKAIDTTRFFVICMNVIGSCYGSLGPKVCRCPSVVLSLIITSCFITFHVSCCSSMICRAWRRMAGRTRGGFRTSPFETLSGCTGDLSTTSCPSTRLSSSPM